MKNRTTRIGMTALAILLAAGATVNAVPSLQVSPLYMPKNRTHRPLQ